MAWITTLLVQLAILVVSYALAPKPKTPKPDAAKQSEAPTADAGKPKPVVFGTIEVKGLNCLGYYDQYMSSFKVKV
jgi:hypothetical protein